MGEGAGDGGAAVAVAVGTAVWVAGETGVASATAIEAAPVVAIMGVPAKGRRSPQPANASEAAMTPARPAKRHIPATDDRCTLGNICFTRWVGSPGGDNVILPVRSR